MRQKFVYPLWALALFPPTACQHFFLYFFLETHFLFETWACCSVVGILVLLKLLPIVFIAFFAAFSSNFGSSCMEKERQFLLYTFVIHPSYIECFSRSKSTQISSLPCNRIGFIFVWSSKRRSQFVFIRLQYSLIYPVSHPPGLRKVGLADPTCWYVVSCHFVLHPSIMPASSTLQRCADITLFQPHKYLHFSMQHHHYNFST